MTYTLHLGVIDVPYTYERPEIKKLAASLQTAKGRAKHESAAAPAVESTGDVAEILEAKYHVIEVFVEEAGLDMIAKAVERSVGNAIKDLFSGSPASAQGASPAADAYAEIEEAFRIFIDQKELDGIVPGVPTAAALAGVNHRMKHPYAKRGPRPSFRDTGLYEASFKVWG